MVGEGSRVGKVISSGYVEKPQKPWAGAQYRDQEKNPDQEYRELKQGLFQPPASAERAFCRPEQATTLALDLYQNRDKKENGKQYLNYVEDCHVAGSSLSDILVSTAMSSQLA